jgi:hypothetical protein
VELEKKQPNLRLPRERRPFPAPNVIRSKRQEILFHRIVLVSDLHCTEARAINLEIISAEAFGTDNAVMHWPRMSSAQKEFDMAIRDALIRDSIPVLVLGDRAKCEMVLVTDIGCLMHVPDQLPHIEAAQGIVLIDDDSVHLENVEKNFVNAFAILPRYIRAKEISELSLQIRSQARSISSLG